jgi:hypothetical protein
MYYKNSWVQDPEEIFSDPGSQNHIFKRLFTNFWVKSNIIFCQLDKIYSCTVPVKINIPDPQNLI